MDIKLINHASVLIQVDNISILTDPWYFGKAFNNSWSLLSHNEPEVEELKDLDYIWISHEHPDHFHLPTLKRLAQLVSNKCKIIIQKKNSTKIEEVLKKFGYRSFIRLRHDSFSSLTKEIDIYSYQVGLMDSIMGIRYKDDVLINVNDCSLQKSEIRHIKRRLGGEAPLLLNQFSLAGNNGSEKDVEKLKSKAEWIINDMIRTHRSFNARATIPFASFMYFSSITNCYMNNYVNRISDVLQAFKKADCKLIVLYFNDSYLNPVENSLQASQRWDDLFISKVKDGDMSSYDTVAIESLEKAVTAKHKILMGRYPRFLMRNLKSVYIHLEDYDSVYELNLYVKKFEEVKTSQYDLKIHSQPLEHALKMPWGVQTIGVGAQYFIESNWKTWSWYRLIFNLNNMEIFLRLRFLLKLQLWEYLINRIRLTSLVTAIIKVKQTFVSPITEE